ncbi:MAG: single-stranded DNA-binding protein [Firmicutes bacterium]|nr:single-stranded DNA-binding protein [Bacillota bacterium]
MLNRIILVGRLVADPQMRFTNNGVEVTTFTLAVDRQFRNPQGEKQTDFIDIVTWRKLAQICNDNLHKGRLVAVEGRLQIRSYEDQNKIRRKAAEVVADNVQFLDRSNREPGGNRPEPSGSGGAGGAEPFEGDATGLPDTDIPAGGDNFDDVPF